MLKEEFIKLCVLCGYASKKNAVRYAEYKEEKGQDLDERDFEEIFTFNERQNDIKKPINWTCNQSGDQLIDDLDRSRPAWGRDVDLNRGLRKKGDTKHERDH